MILGLDVSTSATGFCILTPEGELKEMGYISLAKINELVEKGAHFSGWLTEIIQKYKLTSIWIEEPFQRYAPGMSSARTITRLASFNGVVQYVCYNHTEIIPSLISVRDARAACGIKTMSKKKAGKEVKEQVFEWVDDHLSYPWPTKILKSGPRKGTQIVVPESRDMADAWVIAKAGFVKLLAD